MSTFATFKVPKVLNEPNVSPSLPNFAFSSPFAIPQRYLITPLTVHT